MSAAWRRRAGVLGFFAAMLVVSNVVLPYCDRERWGPFFTWRLFSGLDKKNYYDLEVAGPGFDGLISDDLRFFYYRAEDKIYLWYFTQRLALARESHADSGPSRRQLDAFLAGLQLKAVRLCRVIPPLAEYMLLSPDQKKGQCRDVVP